MARDILCIAVDSSVDDITGSCICSLANGSLVRGWLTPRAGNLTDRLAKLENADAVAEELYLSVFTRAPTAEEKKDVGDFLAKHTKDRSAAIEELAWALLTSAEFRFNH